MAVPVPYSYSCYSYTCNMINCMIDDCNCVTDNRNYMISDCNCIMGNCTCTKSNSKTLILPNHDNTILYAESECVLAIAYVIFYNEVMTLRYLLMSQCQEIIIVLLLECALNMLHANRYKYQCAS